MDVRLLAQGDEKLLMAAAELFNGVVLQPADATARLADPSFVMVVALDDRGEMMGRVYGHVLNRLDVTDLFLHEVDVADEFRRRGAAAGMIDRLKVLCAERGYGEMFVPTEVSNQAGNGLYMAVGGITEGSPANIYVFSTRK